MVLGQHSSRIPLPEIKNFKILRSRLSSYSTFTVGEKNSSRIPLLKIPDLELAPWSHSIRQYNILYKNSHAIRLFGTSRQYHTTLEHRLDPYRTLSTLNISRLTIPHLYCLTPASKPGHTVQTRPLKHRVHFLHRYLSIENLSKLSALLF